MTITVSSYTRNPSRKQEEHKQKVREKLAQLNAEIEAARKPKARLAENISALDRLVDWMRGRA